MVIERIKTSDQNKLFTNLDNIMRVFKRRNVSYVITAHGADAASILLSISGRQGIIQKQLFLVYRGGWEIYYNSKKVYLVGFNEITTVVKKIVTASTTIVSKL